MFLQLISGLAASASASAMFIPRDSNFSMPQIPSTFNTTMYAGAPICTYFNRTFTVNSNNTIYPIGQPASQAALTTVFTDFVSQNSNFTEEYPSSYAPRNGSFSLYFQYCRPSNASAANATTVLELIHGINFDHTYWSFNTTANATQYNFVQAATSAGYSTLAFDRLGVGKSSRPQDGINVTQAATEVALAAAVGNALRNGTLYTGIQPFQNVVAVGHSFGSVQSAGVTQVSPSTFDAVVLTGFTLDGDAVPVALSAFVSTIASVYNSTKYPSEKFPNTYLVTGSPQVGDRQNFWYGGGYDEAVFQAAEASKQTFTIGELLTLPGNSSASPFTGDVFVVTGSHDFIYCFGSCYNTDGSSIPAEVETLFPNAASFDTFIPAYTGHALNLHYTAPQSYAAITEWLADHGY